MDNNIERQFEALGTINYIKIYDLYDDILLDKAVNRVLEIDDLMSAFKANSDISKLNQNAGKVATTLSRETIELLSLAKDFSELSDDAFDITVRPLVNLWGIGKKANFIPEQTEIDKHTKLVNYRDIIIDEKSSTAYLKQSGQAVDLGGIAKGYAADEVKDILTEGGVTSAIINLGGNVITIGLRPDQAPWRIGIQNPLLPTGLYLGTVSTANQTIVTSGSNERFFIKDGIRYHHILDPRTGEPARCGLLSVTAVCESSVKADALTTALFVLGIERGIALLKALNADAIFITDECSVFVTEGLLQHFTMTNTDKQ